MTKLRSGLGLALAAAALSVAGGAFAKDASTPQAYIPFANHGGIRDWAADRTQGVWVQDVHRQWYYAKLMGPCIGLDFAQSIGFETRPQGRFDQFSSIVVPGNGRCAVQTLTQSGAPPSKAHRKGSARDEAR